MVTYAQRGTYVSNSLCIHTQDSGGYELGMAIKTNDTLEVLDISWNHLRRKGAVCVAVGLGENAGLLEFNMSHNGLCRYGKLLY